jgi:hypothetical protein
MRVWLSWKDKGRLCVRLCSLPCHDLSLSGQFPLSARRSEYSESGTRGLLFVFQSSAAGQLISFR